MSTAHASAIAVVTTPRPRIILSLLEGTSSTTIAPAIGRKVVMVMAHCCQVVSFMSFLVPYLKMNRLSAITPANSPTAYHWTLPHCTTRSPLALGGGPGAGPCADRPHRGAGAVAGGGEDVAAAPQDCAGPPAGGHA